MQTYTHLLIATATAPFISHNPSFQAAWIIGNVFPDTTVALQYALDKFKGKKPLLIEPPLWVLAKNICHSLIIGLILLTFIENDVVALFASGMILHIIIDIFTHNRILSNCVYAWPIRLQSFCLWEYQIGTGILRPRLPELILDISCLIITFIYFL